MNDSYDTLIITFSEPIRVLDGMFEDTDTWGVSTLKEWVDTYESTRFTPINDYTAVITSEQAWNRKRSEPIKALTFSISYRR